MICIKNLLIATALAIVASGCASNIQTSDSIKPDTKSQVPNIAVKVDCGSCQVKAGIQELIVAGYKESAANSGVNISELDFANLNIKEFSSRDDVARFLVGAFAGKDEIKVEVAYRGKVFVVEDYYRNAWQGADSLARKIGALVFEKLK
jgi:hypothetical protein